MTQYTVPDSVPYPDHNDWNPTGPGNLTWEYGVAEVRQLAKESALALQVALTKRATDADAAKKDAIDDATTKYGGLPARVAVVEQKNTVQDTAIAAAHWSKGAPPNGGDIFALSEGLYTITSTSNAATMINLPEARPGVVTVSRTTAGIYKRISFVPYNRTYTYRTSTKALDSSMFPWSKEGYEQGSIADGSDMFTLAPGVHVIGSNASAATMLNLPEARAGVVIYSGSTASGMKQVEFWPYDRDYRYTTVNIATNGSTMRPWDKEYPNIGVQNVAIRRALLVDHARRRRGGTIGVKTAAIAFRFDHWLTDFKTKVMPLLDQFRLPASQAIIPSLVGSGTNSMTYAELQTWCLTGGGELLNHGLGDHVGTNVVSEYEAQILTGLSSLKAGTPRLAIEGWNSPGVGTNSWGGFAPMETYDRWNTYAGQLVLANHAVASGSIGNIYRDLDGSNQIGPNHLTIDNATASQIKVTIDRMVKIGMGGVIMLHPNMLDQPGRITTAALEEVLAYVAQLRDQGKLEILSQTGLHFADAGSDRRSDWIWNGGFTAGLTDWTGTGYTATTEGGETFARSTASATTLTQQTVIPDIGLGSQRELIYRVRATSGATVCMKAGLTSKDIVLPASPGWQTVRAFTTIPLDHVLPWLDVEIGRVAGGAIDVEHVRLQAI